MVPSSIGPGSAAPGPAKYFLKYDPVITPDMTLPSNKSTMNSAHLSKRTLGHIQTVVAADVNHGLVTNDIAD